MAAKKATTKSESEALDRQVNELSLRGYTQEEIAAKVGMSRQGVASRLKNLNERARLAREEYLLESLRTLTWAQREAMDAWDASKAAAETVTVETKGAGQGRALKRTEARSGEAAHLANVVKINESKRKLLGLDAAAKSAGLTFTPEQLAALSDDELEALYAKLSG